jgi:hypothetical protein
MDTEEDVDNRLIFFLENLATGLSQKTLLPKQVALIGDFYMSYQFQDQAIRDNDTSAQIDEQSYSDAEFITFLVLGWYIYKCILREKPIPEV